MSRSIVIDPWTEKAIIEKVDANFAEVTECILDDCGEEALEAMNWRDVAELFFCNGYINGAIEASKDDKFMDDIRLMNDETDYQVENGF